MIWYCLKMCFSSRGFSLNLLEREKSYFMKKFDKKNNTNNLLYLKTNCKYVHWVQSKLKWFSISILFYLFLQQNDIRWIFAQRNAEKLQISCWCSSQNLQVSIIMPKLLQILLWLFVHQTAGNSWICWNWQIYYYSNYLWYVPPVCYRNYNSVSSAILIILSFFVDQLLFNCNLSVQDIKNKA